MLLRPSLATLSNCWNTLAASMDSRDKPFLLAPGHIQPQYLVRSQGSHSLPKYLHDEPLPPAPDEGHLYPVTLLHPGHHYTMPRQAPRTRQGRSVEVGQLVPSVPRYQAQHTMSGITWQEKYQGRLPRYAPKQNSQRSSKVDEKKISGCSCYCFSLLNILAQIFLHGVLVLTLYWIFQFHWDGEGLPFSWSVTEGVDLERLWNLHPVLMVTGFIYCMGQAILVYWSGSCCRQICSKLLYIVFHLLGIPCVVLGFLSIWIWKNYEGNAHLYSIHSWLGLVTMGLALLQLALGVISFLLLLCCQSVSSRFRAATDPIHSTLATTTFMLAIATAIAGITKTAFFKLGTAETGSARPLFGEYSQLSEEAIFLNTIGVILIALAVVVPVIVSCQGWGRRGRRGKREQ